MSKSLRDAAFAVDDLTVQWSARGSLAAGFWPLNAVDAGGVAFMLVDANLIKGGGDDDEEDMHWRRAQHAARKPPSAPSDLRHSEDDAFPPDHWVVYLGGL